MPDEYSRPTINRLSLRCCMATRIKFEDSDFEIQFDNNRIHLVQNGEHSTYINAKAQHVPYKATMLGGFVLEETADTPVEYKRYFQIFWEDNLNPPELIFRKMPVRIAQEYSGGQHIELSMAEVNRYRIIYQDGVTATYTRKAERSYNFLFSTGFHGSIQRTEEGAHCIIFKGDVLDPETDGYSQESRFIVTRSRYTDNLILLFREPVTVILE